MISENGSFQQSVDFQALPYCFFKASTVAAPNVKPKISDHMTTALTISLGIASRKQKRNQKPTTDVGTLITIQNSFHE